MKGSMMKGDTSKMCMGGMCTMCYGWKWLLIGIILILARWFYPAWDIWMVIGVLFVVGGLIKFVIPCCPHCR